MSLSLAFAQTTLMLRDVLLLGLRRDIGWAMTGDAPRVTMLPHGKPDRGSGERINLGLVSALPSTISPDVEHAFDLRYLVTAHVFVGLHVELLLGMVLQTVIDTPVLGGAPPANVEPIEAALNSTTGRADTPSRLSLASIAGLHLEPLRLPAVIIDVSPVVAATAIVHRLVAGR